MVCLCGGTEFYLRNGRPFGTKCKECIKIRSRKNYTDNKEIRLEASKRKYKENPEPRKRAAIEYRKRNPDKKKDYDLRRNYGITLIDFRDMVIQQNNKCLLCDKETTLVPDHDHNTLLIRGLLCELCNKGLGLFKDNPDVLKRAVLYVENPT